MKIEEFNKETDKKLPLHPKGWRNLYFSTRNWNTPTSSYRAGSFHYGKGIFSSKADAEKAVADSSPLTGYKMGWCEYLGAFEVEG